MEQYVSLEALKRGAEVFTNISCVGETDLVLIHNGIVAQCDVKTMKWDPVSQLWKSNHQHKPPEDVYYVMVNPETYQIRWLRNKKPAGLENFWN